MKGRDSVAAYPPVVVVIGSGKGSELTKLFAAQGWEVRRCSDLQQAASAAGSWEAIAVVLDRRENQTDPLELVFTIRDGNQNAPIAIVGKFERLEEQWLLRMERVYLIDPDSSDAMRRMIALLEWIPAEQSFVPSKNHSRGAIRRRH